MVGKYAREDFLHMFHLNPSRPELITCKNASVFYHLLARGNADDLKTYTI